jgi:hypothetical protein
VTPVLTALAVMHTKKKIIPTEIQPSRESGMSFSLQTVLSSVTCLGFREKKGCPTHKVNCKSQSFSLINKEEILAGFVLFPCTYFIVFSLAILS